MTEYGVGSIPILQTVYLSLISIDYSPSPSYFRLQIRVQKEDNVEPVFYCVPPAHKAFTP